MKLWQFKPLDTCFFRGAKPFNAGEGGFLDSQFPPTAQTLTGVIRSSIAEAKGVNWADFHAGKQEAIAELIGKSADNTGALLFSGPYILQNGTRLYPLPLNLLYSEEKDKWNRLLPAGKCLQTDQGKLCLPEARKDSAEGAKPIENAWLDANNMQKVLNGEKPEKYYKEKDLFEAESRTGIGRDNAKRMAKDGQLYFTRHTRLKKKISIGMGVSGADSIQPASTVRFGGEGRIASLSVDSRSNPGLDLCRHDGGDSKKLILVLLTNGDFAGKSEPDFPEGVSLISACVGKAVREGGWDYKQRQPKPLKSLVPAGSVYFVEGDAAKINTHIGERITFGYGEIAVGIW